MKAKKTEEKVKTDGFNIVGPGIKVFDFKDIEREGTREVIPMNERKSQSITFKNVRDRSTGIWYGIVIGIDPKDQRPLFKRITLVGRHSYNLENEEDALEWAVVKRHPSVLGSPMAMGKPLLRPYDAKAEAVIKLSKIRRAKKAVDIALNQLSGNDLADFARNLGISPENNPQEIVLLLVAEKAEKNPEEFLNLYADANKAVLQIINRARAVALISYSIEKGLVFKETYPLGSSDITAIAHLRENPQMLASIDAESRELSNVKYGTDEPKIEIRDDGGKKQVEVVKPTEKIPEEEKKQEPKPEVLKVDNSEVTKTSAPTETDHNLLSDDDEKVLSMSNKKPSSVAEGLNEE